MELFKPIKPALKVIFPLVHTERADLYCYFYGRSLELLAPSGMLAFISSNKWFRSEYGEKLRSLVAQSCAIRSITDFRDLPVFQSATAYPMIFVARKKRDSGTDAMYTLVPSLEPPYPDITLLIQKHGFILPSGATSGPNWKLVTAERTTMIDTMNRSGMPLSEYVKGAIYRGVVTGYDRAFIITSETKKQLASNPDCRKILRPLVAGKNIRKWRVDFADKWLIYSHHGISRKGLEPILKHLADHRQGLERRATKQKWYELQQPQHAYLKAFQGPKIIYPEVSASPRFTLDLSGYFPLKTAFVIPLDDLYLLGVLNSSSFAAYQRLKQNTVRGGYLMNSRIYLETTPIPNATGKDKKHVESLVVKCLERRGENCERWEAELDQVVSKLYGLTTVPSASAEDLS